MRTVATLTCLLLLTACGGSPEATKTTPTPSPESVAASPSPSGVPPNVGETALQVGEWREGSGMRSRVIKVVQPSKVKLPSYMDGGESDAMGALVKVQECVRPDAPQPFTVAVEDWFASDKDGGQYVPSSSRWDDWPPLPQFPWIGKKIRPGACALGWVLLQAPRNTKIVSVSLIGDPVSAEWLVN